MNVTRAADPIPADGPVGSDASSVDPGVVAAMRALADPVRLQVAGAVVARRRSAASIVEATELPRSVVDRALGALELAQLARRDGDEWSFDVRRLGEVSRALAALAGTLAAETPPLRTPDGREVSAEDGRVLRAFLLDGRLTTIPVNDRKRAVILRWLLESVFAEPRDYPEREVNQRLALFHPDVAALRRYMVDAGLVTRDHGIYRRADTGAWPGVGTPVEESPAEAPPTT
jgi:DNA-binding transcriptional ArsR family regulator